MKESTYRWITVAIAILALLISLWALMPRAEAKKEKDEEPPEEPEEQAPSDISFVEGDPFSENGAGDWMPWQP